MKKYFKDSRGEIRRFNINGVKFNALFTKKGAFRSGDYHRSAQYDLILKGRFEIKMRRGNRDVVIRRGSNSLVKIPPRVPHLFKALSNSVMIEWWDGPFEARYYKPYRKFVDKSIDRKNRK